MLNANIHENELKIQLVNATLVIFNFLVHYVCLTKKSRITFFELDGTAPKVITRFFRVYSKLAKQSDLEINNQIFFLACCLTVVPHIVHNHV